MSDRTPDLEERIARLLGDAELGHDPLRTDPTIRRVIELLDQASTDDEFDAPPESLWDAIVAGVAGDDTDEAIETDEAIDEQPPGADPGTSNETDDTVTNLDSRRRATQTPPPWWIGAAAAVFVVLVVAVSAIAIFNADDDFQVEQLAAAQLEVLLDVEAAGSAALVRVSDDDQLELHVEVSGLVPIDGYYEVWLLTPEVDGLISLGPLRTDGRYQLPRGLDPAEFSVVDISIEPHDGDPNHSGNSVLRGGLIEA